MSQEEISNSINKYFWFDKKSRVGNLNKISGQEVYPSLGDDIDGIEEESFGNPTYGICSGNLDVTK